MNPLSSAVLGIVFWLLALFQVVVMAWVWKYNDPGKHTSEPHEDAKDPWQTFLKKWVISHKVAGLLYTVIYIIMMSQMVPRMWNYQVELPPRTVAHLCIGLSIGVILFSKIAVIRFFKHLASVLPIFGFLLFFLTTILLCLSVPLAFQEQRLITTTRAFSAENMVRIERLLPKAGYSESEASKLSNVQVMKAGRRVLLQKCVQCHDLRTILAKPRTPKGWSDLVWRMVKKPSIGIPIDGGEIDHVTTYLVGITPDLQQSLKEKRATEMVQISAEVSPDTKIKVELDKALAQSLLEETCTQCHELSDIDDHGGDSEEGWRETVARMVDENGLVEESEVLEQIILFLTETRPVQVSFNENKNR